MRLCLQKDYSLGSIPPGSVNNVCGRAAVPAVCDVLNHCSHDLWHPNMLTLRSKFEAAVQLGPSISPGRGSESMLLHGVPRAGRPGGSVPAKRIHAVPQVHEPSAVKDLMGIA